MRKEISSGAEWEAQVGYSRAVRIGPYVAVAGTTGDSPYARLGSAAEAYRQARSALEKIAKALAQAGLGPKDVIRTRIFVRDIERDWRAVGTAHAEFFGDVRPAASMLEVNRMIDPKMLVEIEADAVAS